MGYYCDQHARHEFSQIEDPGRASQPLVAAQRASGCVPIIDHGGRTTSTLTPTQQLCQVLHNSLLA
jgi:hypothetical protein